MTQLEAIQNVLNSYVGKNWQAEKNIDYFECIAKKISKLVLISITPTKKSSSLRSSGIKKLDYLPYILEILQFL